MNFLEVLCEGSSDVPAVREVLTRRFELVEEETFRIHPHQGKGRLPGSDRLLKAPPGRQNQLLTQLPIKLKNYGSQAVGGYATSVLVLVDADREDCRSLKERLATVYENLPTKPERCLFRIAVEETESWFLADPDAVKGAYPRAKVAALRRHAPDSVCGAWERLAEAIGEDPRACTGADKVRWAEKISPFLDLEEPRSPSLAALINGVPGLLAGDP